MSSDLLWLIAEGRPRAAQVPIPLVMEARGRKMMTLTQRVELQTLLQQRAQERPLDLQEGEEAHIESAQRLYLLVSVGLSSLPSPLEVGSLNLPVRSLSPSRVLHAQSQMSDALAPALAFVEISSSS